MSDIKKRHLSSFQIIIFGFAGTILFGSFLLMLPISSKSNEVTNFLDALFTATSSVCVTGLIINDTATYWSFFGQLIIITLIQIGGLGVVTVAVAVVMVSGRRIGLMQRSTMQTAISASKVGGIVKLTGFILKMTFAIELLGAVVMAPVFCRDFGFFNGIWMAVFHSVSAYCNAGFDIMGTSAPFSSLVEYSVQPVINITIMFLIVIGGIGFLTLDDIKTNKYRLKRYSLQSKIVLCTTFVLILLPSLYFFFFEFKDVSIGERILNSLFQSVTPRTAGFNTVNLTSMGTISQIIMMLLMLIGGSPGSTAGGMKTTTVSVLFFSAISVIRQKDSVECFRRRVSDNIVKNAVTIFLMYLFLFFTGGLIISSVEGLPVLECLYEAASAVGTVGLSLGITQELGVVSKVILMLLMFFGRVGGMTLVYAALQGKYQTSKMPQEKVTVG